MDFRRNSTKLNENIVKAKTWWARIKGNQPTKSSETVEPNAFRPTGRGSSADRAAPPSNSPGDDLW
jgi:hypothetical protein